MVISRESDVDTIKYGNSVLWLRSTPSMKRFMTNPHQYHGAILSDLTFLHSLDPKETFDG